MGNVKKYDSEPYNNQLTEWRYGEVMMLGYIDVERRLRKIGTA
jgi:hypothetical protein